MPTPPDWHDPDLRARLAYYAWDTPFDLEGYMADEHRRVAPEMPFDAALADSFPND